MTPINRTAFNQSEYLAVVSAKDVIESPNCKVEACAEDHAASNVSIKTRDNPEEVRLSPRAKMPQLDPFESSCK